MGLDFTNIPDRDGAALYILHTGNTVELDKFVRLKSGIASQGDHQVELIDVNSADGEKVRDFYDIAPESLPVAFIIMDDDSITYRWDGDAIPTDPGEIIYHLRQASA